MDIARSTVPADMFRPLQSPKSDIFNAPDMFKEALLCTSVGRMLLTAVVTVLVAVAKVSVVLLATVEVVVLVDAVTVVVDIVKGNSVV